MSNKKPFLGYVIPLVMLTVLLVFIGIAVRAPQNPFLPLPQEGFAVPSFALPDLWQTDNLVSDKTLPAGQVSLLHVWGAWCSACRHEHRMMMQIAQLYHIPIYSLDYKDNPDTARIWLSQQGNPYVATGVDRNGQVSRSLGVYGTPETFLVDKHGMIRYQHIGIINETTWLEEIFPLINQYKQAN